MYKQYFKESGSDDLSKRIKKIIKDLGFKPNEFSVTKRRGGYSTAINIRSKNQNHTHEDLKKVHDATKSLDQIDYDHKSGEILAGGNTYIFIIDFDDTIRSFRN